jgi:hypothetical protein
VRDRVPAIRDDHIFDVIGATPHHRADRRAECGFATEGQDRHLKLSRRAKGQDGGFWWRSPLLSRPTPCAWHPKVIANKYNRSAPVGMSALLCAHSGARFGTASRLCLPGYCWPFAMFHSFAATAGPLTAVLDTSFIPPRFRTHCACSATRRRLILLCSYS